MGLGSDAVCASWLQGPDYTGAELIATLLSANTIGHGTFDVGTTAFAFAAGVVGVPADSSITVNDVSAYFLNGDGRFTSYFAGHRSDNLPGGPAAPPYRGATPQAQGTVLVHEIAHLINLRRGFPAGYQHDFGNKKAGEENDKLVDRFCRTLIQGLQ